MPLELDSLEVLRLGAGSPLLVLHGETTLSRDLRCIDLLSRQFEVIAPSHPGFGSSPRADDFDSMYDLVRHYAEFIDVLNLGVDPIAVLRND